MPKCQGVLRYGATVGATGALAGSGCAFALTKAIESYLYGFPAQQPAMFAALGIACMTIVTLASYVPARRAMCVNPIETLRME